MSKVFLVTGAGRGLGRSIVEAALAAGHQVVAGVRNPSQLDGLVGLHREALRPVALDVTDVDAATAAVHEAVDLFGRLDVVVNNAGYANVASVEEMGVEDFRAQIDTNLFGVFNVTKAALPVMRAQGAGHVIQISSVGGRLATPGLCAYQAAKWAVGGFSSVLAAEVGPLGIKVTVLEPGGMRTEWAGSSMTIHPVSGPYEPTVGAMARRFETSGATMAGDPAKVAQVVLTVANLDEPPLRLVLGSDAVKYATAAAEEQAASDLRWRDLSVSTDHDDATPAQLDPLAAREA
jgi:NAD(P)-dependent dehydrogenase (short-subunit alcohol dehydrogenase family)